MEQCEFYLNTGDICQFETDSKEGMVDHIVHTHGVQEANEYLGV